MKKYSIVFDKKLGLEDEIIEADMMELPDRDDFLSIVIFRGSEMIKKDFGIINTIKSEYILQKR